MTASKKTLDNISELKRRMKTARSIYYYRHASKKNRVLVKTDHEYVVLSFHLTDQRLLSDDLQKAVAQVVSEPKNTVCSFDERDDIVLR